MKRLYFFRPNLKNHFNLYYSWISAANKVGVDVTMFTVMSQKQKSVQEDYYNEVIQLENVKIIVTPHIYLNTLYTIFYLIINVVKNGDVVLIAKKVNFFPLNVVKKIFSQRFRYLVEIEGDAVSESQYLKTNIYKKDFYYDYLISEAKSIKKLPIVFSKADGVLVLSHSFKKLLLERHSFMKAEQIEVISTGFIKGRFSFNEDARNEYRNRLGIGNETLFVYAGNVYYSWQNIKKTLEFFAYYLDNIDDNAKFLILTHKSEQYIAQGFIDELSISYKSIILKEVANSEITNYYNAADVSLLLRDNDLMNRVASPGKIGEYAASGTPILTSTYIGDYSDIFKSQRLVSQVDDISNFKCMAGKVLVLLNVSKKEKVDLSCWSNDRLSSDSNIESFIRAFNI